MCTPDPVDHRNRWDHTGWAGQRWPEGPGSDGPIIERFAGLRELITMCDPRPATTAERAAADRWFRDKRRETRERTGRPFPFASVRLALAAVVLALAACSNNEGPEPVDPPDCWPNCTTRP